MATPFTITGSRLQNATRVNQAAEDADVADWAKADDFILCMMIEVGGAGGSGTLELRWRNVTDSGSFAALGNTGELNWNGITDLVDGNAVTAGEEVCTPISGTTRADGVEKEGTNTVSPNLPADYYVEAQWAIDASSGLDGKQYEFQLYDTTDGSAVGTGLAQITTASAITETITAETFAAVTEQSLNAITEEILSAATFAICIEQNFNLNSSELIAAISMQPIIGQNITEIILGRETLTAATFTTITGQDFTEITGGLETITNATFTALIEQDLTIVADTHITMDAATFVRIIGRNLTETGAAILPDNIYRDLYDSIRVKEGFEITDIDRDYP